MLPGNCTDIFKYIYTYIYSCEFERNIYIIDRDSLFSITTNEGFVHISSFKIITRRKNVTGNEFVS